MANKQVTVKRGQTIFDVSLAEYGHSEGVEWILEDNPSVQLHTVAEGDILSIRKAEYKDKSIVQYYQQKGHTPTTN